MAKSSFIGKRYVGRTGKMIVNRTMTIGKYRYTFDKDWEKSSKKYENLQKNNYLCSWLSADLYAVQCCIGQHILIIDHFQ